MIEPRPVYRMSPDIQALASAFGFLPATAPREGAGQLFRLLTIRTRVLGSFALLAIAFLLALSAVTGFWGFTIQIVATPVVIAVAIISAFWMFARPLNKNTRTRLRTRIYRLVRHILAKSPVPNAPAKAPGMSNDQSSTMKESAEHRRAWIRIVGSANFQTSLLFQTQIHELMQMSYEEYIIDLSGCVLMDSTFLGVLAGFGATLGEPEASRIELLNAPDRVVELIETLGVRHLFKVTSGVRQMPEDTDTFTIQTLNPTIEQVTRTSLEAHRTLVAINPRNLARFGDAIQALEKSLKRSTPSND